MLMYLKLCCYDSASLMAWITAGTGLTSAEPLFKYSRCTLMLAWKAESLGPSPLKDTLRDTHAYTHRFSYSHCLASMTHTRTLTYTVFHPLTTIAIRILYPPRMLYPLFSSINKFIFVSYILVLASVHACGSYEPGLEQRTILHVICRPSIPFTINYNPSSLVS